MTLTLGLPRMHKERGERRDFLPSLVAAAARAGARVRLEHGVGAGLGLQPSHYAAAANVEWVSAAEAWACDVVLVLRSPEVEEYAARLRRGTTLVSMLHLPTRPRRVKKLLELSVEAVSLDSLTDDFGARRVENTRAVGWNGLDASFAALQQLSPWRVAPGTGPLKVTVLGSGQVGRHAVDAATKWGSPSRAEAWSREERPPVVVTVVGRALMRRPACVRELLSSTDLLVDASAREDTSAPLVPNTWLGELPQHAVVCDLVVDPYVLTGRPKTVRSIEGVPRGDLDQQVFEVNDPAWASTVPASVPQHYRRTVVSCYSWPGVQPSACMEHYGRQLEPLLVKLLKKGGARQLSADSPDADERALWRGSLRAFVGASRRVPTPAETAVVKPDAPALLVP